MYPTTQKFKDNIYADDRTVVGQVTFDISDVTAAGDVTSTVVTAEASYSDETQLVNKVRDATYNLATLETDRFRLDGTFSFPDSTLANNGEVGFVSSNLCDSLGVFAVSPTITFTFGSVHSSIGLTITFDRFNDEYATEFNMSAYDAANVLITSVNVTGNTSALVSPVGLLSNYKKIVVTITKWSVGNRRARVLEVDFGIVKVYTDSSLVHMRLIEDMDMTTGTVPSAEFDFSVDNSDRAFNILNPTGFYSYLQERQQIIAELGVDIGSGVYEYVQVGEYLLKEWKSPEGSLTATFTAQTNLDLMAGFDYECLVASATNLHALAVSVFAICGITNYSIDSALLAISTNSLATKTDCKSLLQMIAIAGCANIYVTRGNVITLKCITMGTAVDTVTLANMYNEAQVVLDPIVKQVDVTYWTNLSTSTVVSVAASGVTVGDTLKLESNTLINTSARATAVATWILAQKDYRAKYSMNWRGNPSHELADVIGIENSYGSNKNAFITRNELEYRGYLSGKTEAKGAI